jgi:acetyl esterase/lipase
MAAIMDWDSAYANAAAISGAEAIVASWAPRAEAFRARAPGALDIPYGPHPRERLDLFAPPGRPAGVIVLFHGGYWKAFEKSAWSWMAEGALAHGWAVALPSYPLAPEARISEIAFCAARAAKAAAARIPGPVVLSGHSAGGHLACRLMCEGAALATDVTARVARVVSVSGVHDLRPLLRTAMNATLRLDAAEAAAESPALLTPREGLRLTAWVGGAELPEFRRQTALIANIWTGLGADAEAAEAPGRHHFDVIDALADPASALVARLSGA